MFNLSRSYWHYFISIKHRDLSLNSFQDLYIYFSQFGDYQPHEYWRKTILYLDLMWLNILKEHMKSVINSNLHLLVLIHYWSAVNLCRKIHRFHSLVVYCLINWILILYFINFVTLTTFLAWRQMILHFVFYIQTWN